MLDDTIILVHRSMPGHNRKLSGSADENTTYPRFFARMTVGKRGPSYMTCEIVCGERSQPWWAVPLSHRYKFDLTNDSPLGYKLHLNAIEQPEMAGLFLSVTMVSFAPKIRVRHGGICVWLFVRIVTMGHSSM